jgi:hypothetical protein
MCGVVNVSHFAKHKPGNLSTMGCPFGTKPVRSRRKRFRPLSGQAEFGFGARGHNNFAAQGFSAELPAARGAAQPLMR